MTLLGTIETIGMVLFLFFLMIGLLIYFATVYNGLIRVTENIEKAWANIDVILKQRHDEIPKLVEICEQFTQYERSTLAKIVELRNQAINAVKISDIANKENIITEYIGKIFAIAEAYPELKSNTNILQLQHRITTLENELADRRELYNDSVNLYNIRIQEIPDAFIAKLKGLKEKEMFKVTEDEKKDVDLSLNLPK